MHRAEIARFQLARDVRQQNDANGNTHYAQGQLIKPVGIVKVGVGARLHRGDVGADHDVELGDAARDQRRNAKLNETPRAIRVLGPAQPKQHPVPRRIAGQHRELDHPGNRDSARQNDTGGGRAAQAQPIGEPHGDGEHHIEQDLRRRGRSILPESAQHTGVKRHQRHADEIGKGDPRQQHREVEFLLVAGKPEGDEGQHPGHRDLGQHRESQQHGEKPRQRLLREPLGDARPLSFQPVGEQRHEGRVERPFGKQPPEQVGDAECHNEGISNQAGAQHIGDELIAHESQHAADGREPADGGEGAVEGHGALFSLRVPSPSWSRWQRQGGIVADHDRASSPRGLTLCLRSADTFLSRGPRLVSASGPAWIRRCLKARVPSAG